MHREEFSRPLIDTLQRVMQKRSLRQRDLAGELGITQPHLSRILSGDREPNFSVAAYWLHKLGYEIRIYPRKVEDDAVKRRAFLTAAASITFIPSATAGPYQDSEYLHALATRVNELRDELGSVPVIPTALRHARAIEPVVASNDRRLQSAASELARRSALVFYDAQRFDTAARIGALALTLARAAGDTDAQARAYRTLSQISVDQGRLDRAVAYARRGLALPGLGEDERALLQVRLGRALALIPGQESAARTALYQAQEAGDVSPLYAEYLTGIIGDSLTDLGAYEEAEIALEECLRLSCSRPSSTLSSLLTLERQIATALGRADPGLAAERMLSYANLAPLVTSPRVDRQTKEILAASAPWATVPEMRDARDRLRALTQV